MLLISLPADSDDRLVQYKYRKNMGEPQTNLSKIPSVILSVAKDLFPRNVNYGVIPKVQTNVPSGSISRQNCFRRCRHLDLQEHSQSYQEGESSERKPIHNVCVY